MMVATAFLLAVCLFTPVIAYNNRRHRIFTRLPNHIEKRLMPTVMQSSQGPKLPISRLPFPFMNVQSVGITGRWQESSGNFILKPNSGTKPIGVIHFLGGAFVGAAPHLTYKYLLEELAESGYLVVATPYRLNMDYVKVCDDVLMRFDAVARVLAAEFGPLPVIGIGHSCGALLQTLISSLFPDTPRAVNILISYNNRPVVDAIPAFKGVIVPLSQRIMGSGQGSTRLRRNIGSLRNYFQNAFKVFSDSELSPAFFSAELYPLLEQSLELVDQVPDLLQTIAGGQSEFEPTPIDTKEVCRRMYRARHTLVLKFNNDSFDESDLIMKVLREANTIMRMKRPMIEMKVDFKELVGTHSTPLIPNLALLDASNILPIPVPDIFNPGKVEMVNNLLQSVDGVKDEILIFLEKTVKNVT